MTQLTFSSQFALRVFVLFCVVLSGLSRPTPAQAAFTDPGFNPMARNFVYAILAQPDGKILVGGSFDAVEGPSAQQGIGRFNPDGSLDSSFTPNRVGFVRAIAVQSDGKILLGMDANNLFPAITRLNADGSLDTDFTAPVIRWNTAPGTVDAVLIQADGKIVIGGRFSEVAGQPRQNIARLNADGSLDAGFDPAANGRVHALAVQADGKILAGGDFTELAGQPRTNLARLNADGSLDVAYPITPNVANGRVRALLLQPDGKLLVGGTFGGNLLRLNVDGSIDLGFLVPADDTVYAIALQADGKIVIGGEFNRIKNRNRMFIARVNADGAWDGTFNPGANHAVFAVAAQADGQVWAGGMFTRLGGVARRYVGRTLPTAPMPQPDPTFNPTVNNVVNSLALQADGKIVLGGSFTEVAGQPRSRVARLHADGSLDDSFIPGEGNFTVNAVAVQTNGKILVGGNFSQLGGAARSAIGRLNVDGTLEDSFNPGVLNGSASGQVRTVAVQADGKILVGGQFTSLGGQPRFNIGRLNADGSVDADFNPSADSTVEVFALQPDGKILVGGAFVNLAGELQPYFARLNVDGTLDTSFRPTLNNRVQAIATQPDGKILIGGTFGCPGYSSTVVLRLNGDGTVDETFLRCEDSWPHWFDGAVRALTLQPDGKIVVGGFFQRVDGQPYETLARLNGDGTPDSTFNPTTNGFVNTLIMSADDSILVGGAFGEIGGRSQSAVARLVDPLAGLTERIYLPLTLR